MENHFVNNKAMWVETQKSFGVETVYECSHCKHEVRESERSEYCPKCGWKTQIKNTNTPIANGMKVYMIYNNCLGYVTIDFAYNNNGKLTYHIENSDTFFTQNDIGKTVFFDLKEAEKAMAAIAVKKYHFAADWENAHASEHREFDIESDGDIIPWEKAVQTALQLAKENHSQLDMLEYMWTY